MPSGCGSDCGSPMPSTSGSQAMGDRWWRVAPAMGEQAARALALSARARSTSSTACCSPGRARRQGAADAAWRALATLPQRWSAPVFPLRAADFIARGVRERAGARRRPARGRGGLDRGGFPERRRRRSRRLRMPRTRVYGAADTAARRSIRGPQALRRPALSRASGPPSVLSPSRRARTSGVKSAPRPRCQRPQATAWPTSRRSAVGGRPVGDMSAHPAPWPSRPAPRIVERADRHRQPCS